MSPMDFAKDNRESSEDRNGSGRTLYIHRASRSGQPISVVFLVYDIVTVDDQRVTAFINYLNKYKITNSLSLLLKVAVEVVINERCYKVRTVAKRSALFLRLSSSSGSTTSA